MPDAVDWRSEPSDWTIDREDAAEVRAAFARLSVADQELFELRVVAELSAEEVGSVLGRRPGAVRMAQSRALIRLRGLLEEEAEGRASSTSLPPPGIGSSPTWGSPTDCSPTTGATVR